VHVTRQFGPGIWGAVSATYYAGGRTSLNGVARDDRQSGSRYGATLALPLGGATRSSCSAAAACPPAPARISTPSAWRGSTLWAPALKRA